MEQLYDTVSPGQSMSCVTEFCPTRVKVTEAEICNKDDYAKLKMKEMIRTCDY